MDTERYLLSCYRYIELNPVRARLARRPEDYPYSSYHCNALGRPDGLVSPHPVYLALIAGQGSESAQPNPTPDLTPYRALFDQALSRKQLADIRRGTEKCLGIGQADFLLRVAQLAGGVRSGSESRS